MPLGRNDYLLGCSRASEGEILTHPQARLVRAFQASKRTIDACEAKLEALGQEVERTRDALLREQGGARVLGEQLWAAEEDRRALLPPPPPLPTEVRDEEREVRRKERAAARAERTVAVPPALEVLETR